MTTITDKDLNEALARLAESTKKYKKAVWAYRREQFIHKLKMFALWLVIVIVSESIIIFMFSTWLPKL